MTMEMPSPTALLLSLKRGNNSASNTPESSPMASPVNEKTTLPPKKRLRTSLQTSSPNTTPTFAMPVTVSNINLHEKHMLDQGAKSNTSSCGSSSSSLSSSGSTPSLTSFLYSMTPADHVRAAMARRGRNIDEVAIQARQRFVPPTPERVAAYTVEALAAIRNNDLAALKQLHAEGKSLNGCNQWGESLLHLACRRGYTDIVRFLVETAHVDVYVCDDYGKTVLSDAAWTVEPNLEVVELILHHAPELLVVTDARGCLPLDYVPESHYSVWMSFLTNRAMRNMRKRKQVAVIPQHA